jgi:hypothetical protein
MTAGNTMSALYISSASLSVTNANRRIIGIELVSDTESNVDITLRSVPADADSDDVWLYEPGVADAGGVTVTPGTLALTTSLFAPTVSTPRLVTPGVLALTTSLFAPAVTIGTIVTPGVAVLSTTGFAPTVLTPRLVTPGTLALSTTLFAPSVLTPRLVTPGFLALILSMFEPTVTATDSAGGGGITGGLYKPWISRIRQKTHKGPN